MKYIIFFFLLIFIACSSKKAFYNDKNQYIKIFETNYIDSNYKMVITNKGGTALRCGNYETELPDGMRVNETHLIQQSFKDWYFKPVKAEGEYSALGNTTPQFYISLYLNNTKTESVSIYFNSYNDILTGIYHSKYGAMVPRDSSVCKLFEYFMLQYE